MNFQTLPLSAITRVSPVNPRHDDDDVTQLAATIRAAGLQYPLLVMPRPDASGEYEVIDGGRRWRALKAIGPEDVLVSVEIHDGDESSARLAALAVSVTPRALHPVAEFEAFADMIEGGLDVRAIATAFALSERHVRQRLALGSLARCVREAWRRGEISRDSAEAFTVGPIAAQEALFESWAGTVYAFKLQQPYEIRKALRGDALEPSSTLARFFAGDPARLVAYRDAGGRVDEDLFSDGTGLCDGAIAEKVACDLLQAEADAIAYAEGWGAALVEIDGLPPSRTPIVPLNEDEQACLDRIDDQMSETDDDDEAESALETNRNEILGRAMLRHFPPKARLGLAVVAELTWSGAPVFTRGVKLPEATVAAAAAPDAKSPTLAPLPANDRAATRESVEGEEAPPPNPLAEPGKALRGVIEATVSKTLREVTARRVDIALMFTVAALGSQYGVTGLALRPVHALEGDGNELLKRIRPIAFSEALAECAAASTADLSVAFAGVIGQAFDVTGATMPAMTALLGAARARGANLVTAFEHAIDRKGFFEAAPKAQVLKIVAGLIGEGEAKRVKGYERGQLADYVATLSRDKGHLPSPFADWAHLPALAQANADAIVVDPSGAGATPLAQAMAEAIEADEQSPPRAAKPARKAPPKSDKAPPTGEKPPPKGDKAPAREAKAPAKAAPGKGRKTAASKTAPPARKAAAKSSTQPAATKRAPAKKGKRS
jgi:ParB family chromosome partitioning protein